MYPNFLWLFSSRTDFIKTRKRLGIKDDVFVIAKLARLSDLKGHDFLLDAAASVKKHNPEFKILLIGDGNLKKRFIAKSKQKGINENIIFTGLVNPKEVPYYLQCADVLAHVSLHEGLPRAVVQAFALQIPVVCFNVDGAKDIVRHNQNGFLIPPKDTRHLAQALIKLFDSPDTAKQMGINGYNQVKEIFGSSTMVLSIDFVYKEALKKCGK